MAPFLLLLLAQLPSQDVYRAPSPIRIDAKLDEAAWRDAPVFSAFHFNTWTAGEKEMTDARMLWDDNNLYVAYYCHDRHISAHVTQRHGPVSKDDCVEIFLSPNPEKVKNYYTFEINVIGAMLNRCRTDWWRGPATFPFRNFSHDAAHTPPVDGDRWRLNLNRTGGITNPQNSTWSPIEPPNRSFHSPEAFGTVRFVNQSPPKVAK